MEASIFATCGIVATVSAHGLWSTGSVAVPGLSCSVACGIFPDEASNPVPCIDRQIVNCWITREVLGFPDKI